LTQAGLGAKPQPSGNFRKRDNVFIMRWIKTHQLSESHGEMS
jgi:hypothetical protein